MVGKYIPMRGDIFNAADDGAAAHFINDEFDRAVSSRPDAKVYKVSNINGRVREETIETRYLGQK